MLEIYCKIALRFREFGNIKKLDLQKHLERNIYIYIYIYIYKLTTVVEDDLKAPFLIAATPRCKGGGNSFPCIAPLYPWFVPYNAEC